MRIHLHKLLEQASTLHEEGNLDAAKAIYQQLIQENPQQADALHQLGLLFVQKKALEKAIPLLEQAVALKPRSLIFCNNLANAYASMNQYRQAENNYLKVIALNPDYAQAYNNLGVLAVKQKDYQTAEKYFKQALKKMPYYIDAHYNLGLCLFRRGDIDSAMGHFVAVLAEAEEYIPAHHYLANCYYLKQQYEQAIDQYMYVLQAIPENIEANYNIANILMLQKKYLEAKELYEQVLNLDPNYLDALYNIGVIYSLTESEEKSIEYFRKVLDQESKYLACYYNLARIYAKQQNYPAAIQCYQQILEMNPEDNSSRYLLAALEGQQSAMIAPRAYVEKLFDDYAENFEVELAKLAYAVPQYFSKVLQQCEPQANLTVLDLGCGSGLSGQCLKPYAKQLIGVDLSKKMLEQAKNKNLYHELIQADIHSALQSYNQEIDLISAADTLVYIGDLQTLLQLCQQALKSGGYFIFNTEWIENEDYYLQPSGRFAHGKHYIEQCLIESGFNLRYQEEVILRLQAGKPVKGQIWLASTKTF